MTTDGLDYFPIRVVNIYKEKDYFPAHRPFTLGNPFFMKEEKNRNEVCNRFDFMFQDAVKREDPLIMRELARMIAYAFEKGYINLGCYCYPKRCHALTIRRYLHYVLNPGMSIIELDELTGEANAAAERKEASFNQRQEKKRIRHVNREQKAEHRKKGFRSFRNRTQTRNERWQD